MLLSSNSTFNREWCTVVPATRGHCRFGAKVSPRGRDSHFDTNIYGHMSSAHIVFTLLMHKQNRSGGYENREIRYYLSHDDHHVHCME